MALAIAKAATLRPDIKLSRALNEYEAALSDDQRESYKISPPDAIAVMALTSEVDRQTAKGRTRRCGARLTTFLNSVQGFSAIVEPLVTSSGSPIAGAVWSAVKLSVQVGLFLSLHISSFPLTEA